MQLFLGFAGYSSKAPFDPSIIIFAAILGRRAQPESMHNASTIA
jgi:hypothetical protein